MVETATAGQKCGLFCKLMTHRRALDKIWLRRCAHRVKPATDVHLGVSFTAVVPSSGRFGGFRIPPVHSKLGISTSNHEPGDGVNRHQTTYFTLNSRGDVMTPFRKSVVSPAYFAIKAGLRLGVRIVSSPTCSLFTVPRRCAA